MAGQDPGALDADHPWPGLDVFTESDSTFFRGRETETRALEKLVERQAVTLVFGRSGVGKTSLINAGLLPVLRQKEFIPVCVRVGFQSDDPPPRVQILGRLSAECELRGIEAPAFGESETLWEYFHRTDTEFWTARNRLVTPVLVLDQFEGVFTAGRSDQAVRERCREFLSELGDLIVNRAPPHVRDALEEDDGLTSRFHRQQGGFRLVLSLREDFLPEIEALEREIPPWAHRRFRLQPMNGFQGSEVILAGGNLVSDQAAALIIGVAAGYGTLAPAPAPEGYGDLQIEPGLLSVICNELNYRRKAAGESSISPHLLSGAQDDILSGPYQRSMDGLDERVRIFVEDKLLTESGHRDSFPREDALALPGVTDEALDALIVARVLRVDERSGVMRLELYEGLARAVAESRIGRRAVERAQVGSRRASPGSPRWNRTTAVLVGIALLIVIVTLLVAA